MADEQKIQTETDTVSVTSGKPATGSYVLNDGISSDVSVGVVSQLVADEENVGVETVAIDEANGTAPQETVSQTDVNTETNETTSTVQQEELNNQMWTAVMDLNRLQSPVEPEVGQDGKMSEYHQGEMAGSEEEIEEARARLFDALDKGADINAVKEQGGEKETILNYVVDVELADDLRAHGAKVAGSLEEHRADVDWFKKQMAKAKTPEEKAYAEDMLAISEDMVDYLRGEKAYEVYNKMFDEQTGAFEFLGDEKHPLIRVKGKLSQEDRNDLAEAISFFAEQNGEDPQKTALVRGVIASEKGESILDMDLGKILDSECRKYEEKLSLDENEANANDEVEEMSENTADVAIPENEQETDEAAADVMSSENDATAEATDEYESAFTERRGDEGPTGCLGQPKDTEQQGNRMDDAGNMDGHTEENSARTELHQLADRTNPDDFIWANEAAKNVIADHPEYLNAKSNDQYGVTAMMCAVNKGNLAMLNTLIEKGADVNIPNEYGETALMYAAYHGDMVMMEKLIKNGADITMVAASNSNYAGQDFLGVLAANGHEDMLPAVMELIKGKMQGNINAVRQENEALKGNVSDTAQPDMSGESSAELAKELAKLSAQASQLKSEINQAKNEKTSLLDTLKNHQVERVDVPKQKKQGIIPLEHFNQHAR